GFSGVDYFEHRISFAGVEIQGDRVFALFQMLQGADVGVGQIVDVDVVAEASAVGRGIVGGEDIQLGAIGQGRLKGELDQMRFGIVKFADLAGLVGSGGVEVPQTCYAEIEGMPVRFECVFECELRRSIGIDRFARIRFGNRNFDGNAVNGAGRGENKMADSGVDGGVQKSERARDIVAEIFARVGDGFSHITMSGEVHDGVDPRQNLVEFGLVSDVALD